MPLLAESFAVCLPEERLEAELDVRPEEGDDRSPFLEFAPLCPADRFWAWRAHAVRQRKAARTMFSFMIRLHFEFGGFVLLAAAQKASDSIKLSQKRGKASGKGEKT